MPPRAKDMPPISLRAMACSSAAACISGSISLQVTGRAVQHAGHCASWAVWVVGCVGGPHELLRACIARAALACSSSSTCFAPITDALARPLGTNIQNLGPLDYRAGGRPGLPQTRALRQNSAGEKSNVPRAVVERRMQRGQLVGGPQARVPLYVPYADFFQYQAGAGRLAGRA